ncbi:MAG: Stp1/IreP family PP2C-type Ser/Thr phosphatase [Pseudobdellovibrionaceae bacterium]
MQIQVWCRTDKGLKRDSNQDSYLINKNLGLYIVADGMGGHSGGEVASAMATKVVEDVVYRHHNTSAHPREILSKAYREASNRIYDRASQDSRLTGMGTTMVLCYLKGNSAFVANVGDSRAYLYNKPNFWQLTEDHSLMNEQLRAGVITEDQMKSFMNKNVITRSVGYERDVEVDVLERAIVPGDCFLLCSDGFSGLVPDATAAEILKRTKPEKVADVCVDRALQNGGDDNVTVLYLQVDA